MRNLTLLCAALAFAGCRGETSNQPPVHLVQNMDFQEKLKAPSESKFAGWKDRRGMRLPVHGTVAEPYNIAFPPADLFAPYVAGYTLAETFHQKLPFRYWMNREASESGSDSSAPG